MIERCCLDGWIARRIGGKAATCEAVRAYQLQRIQKAIAYASERCSFYRRLYGGLAVNVRTFSDFQNFPVIGPADIVHSASSMLCVDPEQVCRIYTSGTTAAPKRLFFTEKELSATVEYFEAGSRQFIGPGETALLLFPCHAENGAAQLFGRALTRIGACPLPYGVPASGGEALEVIAASSPHLVLCAPETALAMLALPGKERFSTLLVSGGGLTAEQSKALCSRFSCRVFLQYGLTETAFGLGVDCTAFAGYHLREPDYYVEILDEKNKALPAGVPGRVVMTSLETGAMPLIRYDTGDIARYLPTGCPCGSALPLLSRIRPRNLPKGYRSL